MRWSKTSTISLGPNTVRLYCRYVWTGLNSIATTWTLMGISDCCMKPSRPERGAPPRGSGSAAQSPLTRQRVVSPVASSQGSGTLGNTLSATFVRRGRVTDGPPPRASRTSRVGSNRAVRVRLGQRLRRPSTFARLTVTGEHNRAMKVQLGYDWRAKPPSSHSPPTTTPASTHNCSPKRCARARDMRTTSTPSTDSICPRSQRCDRPSSNGPKTWIASRASSVPPRASPE